MEIKCLKSTLLNTNNYLIVENNTYILIEASVKLELLKKLTTKLNAILITHMHWDHYINLKEIVDFYKCPIYFREEGYEKLLLSNEKLFKLDKSFDCNIDKTFINYVKDNEIIKINDINILPIYTSGHTNCSCSYLINNNLFSGDTMFYHCYGRTDLPTGSETDMLLTIKKLLKLSKEITVYPGHGEKTDINTEMLFYNNLLD